ncbi:cytochrome protein [Lojkania enalia]|uniref:Cytochrome protein n=1 Tax=Lojkania enalia TaxID=147567 RepID=A0A9P4K7X5_9PLEO|nr:cytochrome protein [Didymosphaeria enalia]
MFEVQYSGNGYHCTSPAYFNRRNHSSGTTTSVFAVRRLRERDWRKDRHIFVGIRSPISSIPGPWYSQWTFIVLQYHWLRGQRALYVERLHQKYGPVVRISPNEVEFSSITAAKRIHSHRAPFPKAVFYDKIRIQSMLPNVFNSTDFDYHARHRRLLSAPISQSHLKAVEGVVKARADLAVQRIREEMKTRGAADVLKWWQFMATDVIGELTFGDSFRMLEQGRVNQYIKDLNMVGMFASLRTTFPTTVKFASYLPIPIFRNHNATMDRLRSYTRESLQRYRSLVAADPWNPKPTLFTNLFRAGEEGLSQDEIETDAQAYIVAGSDTTSQTMTYLTWAVCRDSAIKQRLVEEVASLPDDYIDDHLMKLHYLNQVIEETLRLYAAAPSGLPREVPKGGCEIDGYWMPGGLTVATQAYSMHRNPAIYIDPERFNPSRWENASKEMKDSWMPFGGGSRTCIGMHLAKMELRRATAEFFRTFPYARVSSLESFDDADMEQVTYFLVYPKGKKCLIQAS